RTGKPLCGTLEHVGRVFAAAFSPNGEKVVTGSEDGTARFWNASTGEPLSPPLKHEGPVEAVAFSPDGVKVITGCQTGPRLWDAASGRSINVHFVYQHHYTKSVYTPMVYLAAFSPDGKTVLTVSEDAWRMWARVFGGERRSNIWVRC